MKLDERGFAVSVVLYASATIVVLVLILILSVLSTNNKNTLDLTDLVKEQVSGVTGDTYQLYNLVSNGSFENNGISWTTDMNSVNNQLLSSVDTSNFHSGGKSLHITSSGWQFQRIQGVSAGDKLYIGYYAHVVNASGGALSVAFSYNSLQASGGQSPQLISSNEGSYSTNYTSSSFEKGGAIATVPSNTDLFIQIGSSSQINAYLDDVVVVNLTKAFGSGKEPSIGWCNANIKYFNGVTVITNYDDFE